MACQYFASNINNKRGTVRFCEEGKSLLVSRFLQIHSETRHQQSSPDLSLSKTKVREGKAGCNCCCCQSCQVISGCYLSFLLSEIHLIYLQLNISFILPQISCSFVPPQFGFVHIVNKICGLHSAQSHSKIFWSNKSIATDFKLHRYNSSECQEGKNVMPKRQTNKPKHFLLKSKIYAENDFISLIQAIFRVMYSGRILMFKD